MIAFIIHSERQGYLQTDWVDAVVLHQSSFELQPEKPHQSSIKKKKRGSSYMQNGRSDYLEGGKQKRNGVQHRATLMKLWKHWICFTLTSVIEKRKAPRHLVRRFTV